MNKKKHSERLTKQHKLSQGVVGIFGESAKSHEVKVNKLSLEVISHLESRYPNLEFRFRKSISKLEINQALQKLDPALGQTLYVQNANIKPDGGLIEVKDDHDNWRLILVTEAKHQGKDIENIKANKLVGANNDQDLMVAGNAIERSHKNISEIANYMLSESYFPYLIFLDGSNFLTETLFIKRDDGIVVELNYQSGFLNRLDRLTSANYGLPFNTNLCVNRFIKNESKNIMLQASSIYTTGNGTTWESNSMLKIMLEIAETSLKMLATDLFNQITGSDHD